MGQQVCASDRRRLLTVHEVTARLAVSRATVWRLADRGELTRVRIGGSVRFEADDIERLIACGRAACTWANEPSGGRE
jgi:excisionase family DNA binding protein